MSFHGSASRDQLSILRRVLETYRSRHGVAGDSERNDVAEMIMSIFERGTESFDGVTAALEAMSPQQWRRRAWPGDDSGLAGQGKSS